MKISGVYCIYNLQTDRFYIGSSSNVTSRFNAHRNTLRQNKHHSRYLQRSFNIYGEDSFIFEVIDHTENLRELEQKYIDTLMPEYNVCPNALAPMAGRKHSSITLLKFKQRPIKRGKDSPSYGKKWSDELRKKILQKRIGSKRSEMTKRKMSEISKRINSISRIDLTKSYKKIIDTNGVIYNSLSEASKLTNIHIACICDNLRGRSIKTKSGLTFKYYEDKDA